MVGTNKRDQSERVVITPGQVSFYNSKTGILITSDGTERFSDGTKVPLSETRAYTQVTPLPDGTFLTYCHNP